MNVFSSVQSLSHVWFFATPWTAACQASLSITNSRSLLKLVSIESVMPSNYLILCHPLLLLASIFPSLRVFSNESALHIRWPKYQSFSFNISPCNEYSGLISFRMDWLDLLAIQGILKSLLQNHSSKASILRRLRHMLTWGSVSDDGLSLTGLATRPMWSAAPSLSLSGVKGAFLIHWEGDEGRWSSIPSFYRLPSWSPEKLGKTLMLAKTEGRKRRGWQRMR